MAVGLSETAVKDMLGRIKAEETSLAAARINSPQSVTLFGNPKQPENIATVLAGEKMLHRGLKAYVHAIHPN